MRDHSETTLKQEANDRANSPLQSDFAGGVPKHIRIRLNLGIKK